jgi:hypothetical protein
MGAYEGSEGMRGDIVKFLTFISFTIILIFVSHFQSET